MTIEPCIHCGDMPLLRAGCPRCGNPGSEGAGPQAERLKERNKPERRGRDWLKGQQARPKKD